MFTTRYLDLVTNFISPYNTVMKVIFLATTYATVYLVFLKFKATYDSNHDTFRAEFLVIPAVGLSLLVNHEFSVMEVGAASACCCVLCVLAEVLIPGSMLAGFCVQTWQHSMSLCLSSSSFSSSSFSCPVSCWAVGDGI